MVGILENKKIAELAIENSEGGYDKINPESIATIIENDGREAGDTNLTVQEHINNKNIHLTAADAREALKDSYLAWNNGESIKGINAITVIPDEDTKTYTISATIPEISSYMTRDSIKPADETIRIFYDTERENGIKIKANIPDVSHYLVNSNIRAEDDTIHIRKDTFSNNVYLKTNPISYTAGDGLSIKNGVITNTKPDRLVKLIAGDNIDIDGSYNIEHGEDKHAEFVISAKNKLNVDEWVPNFEYKKGDVILHDEGLYYCGVDVSQKEAFDPNDWNVIADYRMTRIQFVTGDAPEAEWDLRDYGLVKAISDTDTLLLNVGGIIAISNAYEVLNGYWIRFNDGTVPANTPIEVMILSNSILNSLDPTANINDWKQNIVYEVGNIVIYDNALYKCIERHPSGDIFDVSKWQILMNYTKDTYSFETEEETLSVEMPISVNDKNNIMINVGNTVLLQSSYDIEEDGKTITFASPIEAGTKIEVTVYTHGVLSVPEIPAPRGRKDMLLISNELGTEYELISKEELILKLGLNTLVQLYGNNSAIIGVNETGTDYKFYSENELSAKVKLRNVTNGFNVLNWNEVRANETDGLISFAKGSTLASDESVLMNSYYDLTKNFTAKWEKGDNKGALLDREYFDVDFVQPVLDGDSPEHLRVTTTSEQTNTPGWKAMDEFQTTGEGWKTAAGVTAAVWQYAHDKPMKISKVYYRNQKQSSTNDRAKNVKLWVSNDVEGSLIDEHKKTYVTDIIQLNNSDTNVKEITIQNPIYGRVFGIDVLDSFGQQGVGALHIQMEGKVGSDIPHNAVGYIYAISNERGTATDIAASFKENENEIEFPDLYTKHKMIGKFYTGDNGEIIDVFPYEDINKFYINRNFVNEDELNDRLNNYTTFIEQKIEELAPTIIEEKISEDLSDIESDIDELENGKLDNSSNELIIYGTNANGNQTTYPKNQFGKVDDVKIGNTSIVENQVVTLGTMSQKSADEYLLKNDAKDTYLKIEGGNYVKSSAITTNGNVPSNVNNASDKKIASEKALVNEIITIKNMINNLYPVGAFFITDDKETSSCPLASIIKQADGSNSVWEIVAKNRVLQGANAISDAGSTKSAGLPNITGKYSASELTEKDRKVYTDGGALYDAGTHPTTKWNANGEENGAPGIIGFDASRSNSIYGNSNTVQPPAYLVNIWRRKK